MYIITCNVAKVHYAHSPLAPLVAWSRDVVTGCTLHADALLRRLLSLLPAAGSASLTRPERPATVARAEHWKRRASFRYQC
jgi:hypothetical protein